MPDPSDRKNHKAAPRASAGEIQAALRLYRSVVIPPSPPDVLSHRSPRDAAAFGWPVIRTARGPGVSQPAHPEPEDIQKLKRKLKALHQTAHMVRSGGSSAAKVFRPSPPSPTPLPVPGTPTCPLPDMLAGPDLSVFLRLIRGTQVRQSHLADGVGVPTFRPAAVRGERARSDTR